MPTSDVDKMVEAVLAAIDAPLKAFSARLDAVTASYAALSMRLDKLGENLQAAADFGQATARSACELAERVKTLEDAPPLQGDPGEPGAPGRDGKDGENGKPGEPGAPGKDGENGKPGEPGAPGKDGANGKDGVGLAGAIIDRDGGLVVTLTDGTTRELGIVVGKDGTNGKDGENGKPGEPGTNGKDGVDGLSLESFDVKPHADGHGFDFTLGDGKASKSVVIRFNNFVYRGVFKAGERYLAGDFVTWGGSVWRCNQDTAKRPGDDHAGEWSLAVKKGTDGKDGKPGAPGDKGAPGKDGRNMTLTGHIG